MIYEGVMIIFEDIGIEFYYVGVKEIFKEVGCIVNGDNVWMDCEFVMEMIVKVFE